MSFLQLSGVAILTIAALMALALNFSTADAPRNYRNALFGLFASQIGVAAFLAYDRLDGLWGIIAVSVSLIYAVGVTIYNRTEMLTPVERRAIFFNPSFWVTSVVSVTAIIVLLLVQHYQH